MGRKHLKTLTAIFSQPPPSNVKWKAVEALIVALGGEVMWLSCSTIGAASSTVHTRALKPNVVSYAAFDAFWRMPGSARKEKSHESSA